MSCRHSSYAYPGTCYRCRRHESLTTSLGFRQEIVRPEDQLRVGNQERDAVQDILSRAFCDGQLTQDEWEQRRDTAHAARYLATLEELIADLPEPAVTPTWGDAIRDWWMVKRDSTNVWSVGILTGIIVAVAPVSTIPTFPGGIYWWKALIIAVTLVCGLYMAIMCAIGASDADTRNRNRKKD